jgi:hypothetical protein
MVGWRFSLMASVNRSRVNCALPFAFHVGDCFYDRMKVVSFQFLVFRVEYSWVKSDG